MMRSAQHLTVSYSLSALKKLAAITLYSLPILLLTDQAFAGSQTLSTYATGVGSKTSTLVDVFNYVAYVIGAVTVALGLSDLKKTAESPQHSWKHGVAKLGFGGAMLSLPAIAGILSGTMDPGQAFQLTLVKTFTFSSGTNTTGGIGDYIRHGINQAGIFVNIAAFVAFIIAVFFTMRGIQMLRSHVENPGQSPLPEALKRMAVGGALFSFPMIVNVIAKTFGASGSGIAASGWSSTSGAQGGLDGMIVHFISDVANPAYQAIEFFCYIAGIMLILFGMQRLVRTAQDGPRGPLSFGTITLFVVAGALLSFPQLLTSLNVSLTGSAGALTQVNFMSLQGVDAAQVQNAKNVFSALLAFMAVIGFLSVVRGLFLLKSFADGGQQASIMSVVTHIVAGSLCINLGAFINAVQTSLGVTDFPVTFN